MKKITVDDIELWKCSHEIAVKSDAYLGERKILIEKDEIVEFRYHYAIHFRTTDDIYCILDEKTFYENFIPYGKIFNDVKSYNKCNLCDILRLQLYEKTK